MSAAEGWDPRAGLREANQRAGGRTLDGLTPPPRRPADRSQSTEPAAEEAPTPAPEAVSEPSQRPNTGRQLEPLPSLPDEVAGEIGDDDLVGIPRGNLRHVRLYLSGPSADFLDEVARRHRYPRGPVVMEAVRRHYREIYDVYRLVPLDEPGPFGPPRVVQRRRLEVEKARYMQASVTVAEAKGLTRMMRETGLSLSAIVEESLERARRQIEKDGADFPGALP